MASGKTSHYEETLQRDIDLIRSKITDMYVLDKRALEDALLGLKENNRQKAYSIILRDRRIDELEKEVDRLCLEFLVRQQPVSLHLRFAYVSIKLNQELERIGDYAESIARQILKISSMEQRPPMEPFEEIAQLAIPMLGDAVKAFLNQDSELAANTMAVEEKADQLRDQINADLYRLREEDKIPLESLTPLLTIARRFERVTDQCKNICEEVLYMCTGEYAKHKGAEVYRILLVDDHDACRTQMAQGIANDIGLPRMIFSSAGLDPTPVDAETQRFMTEKGIDISRQTSKSIEQVPNLEHYQIIIALSEAAKEMFAGKANKTVCLDWHVTDPSKVTGNAEAIRKAYEETYRYIRTHLQDLGDAILGDKIN